MSALFPGLLPARVSSAPSQSDEIVSVSFLHNDSRTPPTSVWDHLTDQCPAISSSPGISCARRHLGLGWRLGHPRCKVGGLEHHENVLGSLRVGTLFLRPLCTSEL